MSNADVVVQIVYGVLIRFVSMQTYDLLHLSPMSTSSFDHPIKHTKKISIYCCIITDYSTLGSASILVKNNIIK